MKRALVLSGGGSKGAYEAGFLLAAKELNQHFDIVTGTSIGEVDRKVFHSVAAYSCHNRQENATGTQSPEVSHIPFDYPARHFSTKISAKKQIHFD